MKKLIALLLALVIILSMAACANEKETPASTEGKDKNTPAATAPSEEVATAIDEEGNSLTIWLYESFSEAANDATLARVEEFEEVYKEELASKDKKYKKMLYNVGSAAFIAVSNALNE